MLNNQPSMYDQFIEALPYDAQLKVREIFLKFITREMSDKQAIAKCIEVSGTSAPMDKLLTSLDVPNEPIPSYDSKSFKKVSNWTSYEDQRLIAAISKYGTSDFNVISKFVGNGRNKLQCVQRWQRSLDPTINKNQWTDEEDYQLLESVKTFGDKKWSKVATLVPGRTDVQCRYRYQLIIKKYPEHVESIKQKQRSQHQNSEFGTKLTQEEENAIDRITKEYQSSPDELFTQQNSASKQSEMSEDDLYMQDSASLLDLLHIISNDPATWFNL